MACTGYQLTRKGSTGTAEPGRREYTATYHIFTDSLLDQAQTVLDYFFTNPALPDTEERTPYTYGNDDDELAFCNRISVPERAGGAGVWEVTVNFSTEEETTGGAGGIDSTGNPTSNPLDFRPDIQTSFYNTTVPVYKAIYRGGYTGGPVLAGGLADGDTITPQNSAGIVFVPGLEKEVGVQRVTLTVNTQSFNNTLANLYLNAVNEDAIKLRDNIGYDFVWELEIPKRTARLNNYSVTVKRESIEISGARQTIDYLSVAVEMLVKKDGWRDEIVDKGDVRAGASGEPDGRGGTFSMADELAGVAPVARITGRDGEPIDRPVLFNGAGQPLDPQNPNNAVYIKFQKYEEKLFMNAPVISYAFTSA